MNDKFTLRDFLVYFTTGSLTLISINLLFFNEILSEITDFFEKYKFISDFSGLLIALVIPVIYFIGHLIHGLDYLSLKMYIYIHNKLTKYKLRKFKIFEVLRLILYFFMYKNKVINSIVQENKEKKTWISIEEFWLYCARLQKVGKFGPAEYWYTLNDLFKGLYIAFLIFSVLSFFLCQIEFGLIFLALALISNFRAIQFAGFFVITVRRLSKC